MKEMKEVNVDTINMIPSSWDILRLKYLCNITTGDGDTQDAVENGEFPFYVRSPIIERSSRYTFDGEGILMAGDGAGAGRVFHHAYGKYAIHQRVYCLYNIKSVDSDYLFYYISNMFPNEMDRGSAQSTVPSVRLPMLLNLSVPYPPPEEQKKIVMFLNSKCAAIDAAIERQKKSISKIDEYLSNLIAYTVLHGLKKDRAMKESGVPWISVFPEDWEIRKGKYLFCETGLTSDTGEGELLTVSQYTGITPRSQKNVTMFQAESLVGYKICEIGDIPANTMWLWAGAIGVSKYRGLISPSYNIYRQRNADYDSEYLDYLLRCTPLVQHYKALSTGIRPSRLRLYPDQFFSIKFPVPSMEEQKEIVSYLGNIKQKVDAARERTNVAINKLQEYRKSLIYHAVTGKIDCSNAQ